MGKKQVPMGKAIRWDAKTLATISDDDKQAAINAWRKDAPKGLERLLDAKS